MDRWRAATAVLLLALVGWSPVLAQGMEPRPAPGHDYAVGGGTNDGAMEIGFNATSGPNGEDPRGHVNVAVHGPQGEVTCLRVVGNQAFIGARMTGPADFTEGGTRPGVFLHVVDNGTPGPEGSPDSILVAIGLPYVPDPATCAPGLLGGPVFRPFQGNVVVHDAPAAAP